MILMPLVFTATSSSMDIKPVHASGVKVLKVSEIRSNNDQHDHSACEMLILNESGLMYQPTRKRTT
jgi:hypothetical protein